MNGRRVRLRRRPEPQIGQDLSGWTLFARLHPDLALDLHDQAAAALGDRQHDFFGNGWSIIPGQRRIDFLPLCMELSNGSKIYTSYNGGSPAEAPSGEQLDTIELSASLLPDTASEDTLLWANVKALPFIPDAQSLNVEPLTTGDWELLEIHADWLEGGGLLGQVSVVYGGQVLCLYVGGQDLVRVKVMVDEDSSEQGPCQRLVADTHVVVRPKPRKIQTASTPSPRLRVLPVWEDYSPRMQELARDECIYPVEVPVGTIHIHPETLCHFGEAGSIVRITKSMREGGNGGSSRLVSAIAAVGRVEASTDIPVGHVALHTLIRRQLLVSAFNDCVRLEKIEDFEGDVSQTNSLVETNALNLSLEPVALLNSDVDTSTPWRYPSGGPSIDKSNRVSSRWEQSSVLSRSDLHSMLLSWLDGAECRQDVPLSQGSLLDFSCLAKGAHSASDTCLYRLTVRNVDERTLPEAFLFAKDIPPLLLLAVSSPVAEGVVQTYLRSPENEHMLNLLPSLPDSGSASSSELQTELARCMTSYDGVILAGERGSGKTHTALVLAARQRLIDGRATVYMDCKQLQSSSSVRMNDMLNALSMAFEEAVDSNPSVLILDDLDELIPNLEFEDGDEESSSQQRQPNPTAVSQSKLIADHIRNFQEDSIEAAGRGKVSVVIASRDETSFAPSVKSSRVFLKSFKVASFGGADREALFGSMLEHKLLAIPFLHGRVHPVHIPGFARKTEGYRPFDLEILGTRVHHDLLTASAETSNGSVDPSKIVQVIHETLDGLVPISRQGISVELTTSNATWEDIGGLFHVKKQLTATILNPVKYSRIYQSAPVRLPRGILLLGPPGCGKSYLVPALAKKCQLTLVTCRGPELLDKYIGASEAKVRQLFQRAYTAAPSLLFLDEFDALAPRRGSDHTGVTDRVVNQLLTFLDGVEVESGKQVYIVGATSRPDKVDPALLRPGRLEQHVFVGFPETDSEWNDVLLKVLDQRNVGAAVLECVRSNQLLQTVREKAPQVRYFSPADIKAAVTTAHLEAVHEYIAQKDGQVEDDRGECVRIGLDHLIASLQSTRPSLSRSDRDMLDRIYRPFQGKDGNQQAESEARPEMDTLRTALR